MFSQKDIKNNLVRVLKSPNAKEMIYVYRVQDDFESQSSEERIDLVTVNDFFPSSLIDFWIKSIQLVNQGWEGEPDYEDYFDGHCMEIKKHEFIDKINCSMSSLKNKLEINTNYSKFYLVRDEWNDVALIARHNDKYIYFNWSTTA